MVEYLIKRRVVASEKNLADLIPSITLLLNIGTVTCSQCEIQSATQHFYRVCQMDIG